MKILAVAIVVVLLLSCVWAVGTIIDLVVDGLLRRGPYEN